MGFLDNIKSFVHSITTEDHYASYDSPYKNSVINNSSNTVGGNNSSSRLNELNRLATLNSSSQSLVGNPNGSASNVGYRPGLRSSNANSSADLPMQMLNAQGQPPLPSIDSLWDRIETWLEDEFPELEDNLNGGVTTADLNEFESDLGCGAVPVEFRQFYKRHDGQLRGGKPSGLFLGLCLMDLESIVEEHAIWGRVSQRLEKQQGALQYGRQQSVEGKSSDSSDRSINTFIANQRSIPPNSIQPYYSHRGWIPIVKDDCGNQIAIDLAPGPNGTWGQLIIFGREYDTKLVIAQSFQEFIFMFVNDLENGNYQINQNNEKDGFLDNSREDFDYVIGKEEEDAGELSFYDRDGKELGNSVEVRTLNYLEVFKIRALKKYGLGEKYSTSFTPQQENMRRQAVEKGLSRVHTPTPPSNKGTSPLIENLSSKVSLPKETIINGDEIEDSIKLESAKAEPSSSPKDVEIEMEQDHGSESKDEPESIADDNEKKSEDKEEIKFQGKEENKNNEQKEETLTSFQKDEQEVNNDSEIKVVEDLKEVEL